MEYGIGDAAQADQQAQQAAVVEAAGERVLAADAVHRRGALVTAVAGGGADLDDVGRVARMQPAFSSGRVTITTGLVSSIGVEKMVSDSGTTPISFSIGWPLVEISTGMLADRPSP